MQPNDCDLHPLAHSDLAQIRRCADCGCVHVDIGPMTVRLDDAGLKMLARTIECAANNVAGHDNVLDWSRRRGSRPGSA